MKNLIASIALHAAVIGGSIAVYEWSGENAEPREARVVYFEVIDGADGAAAEGAAAAEPEREEPKCEEPESPGSPEILELPEYPEYPEYPEIPAPPAPMPAPERARIMSEPYALGRIEPKYPRSARRKGHEGSVTLEVEVASDGTVTAVALKESCGHEELDAAAAAAVRTAHFAPAREDGAAISGTLRLTFDFRLR